MQGLFRDMGEEFFRKAISILQPVTGRFWVVLPDRVFILSAFPGPKITAWSEYHPTDEAGLPFTITAAATHRQHVVVRDDQNRIFSYGGGTDTGVVFDSCPVEIEFPYFAGKDAATQKTYQGIDAAAEGEWDVYAATNIKDPTAEDYLGKIIGPSFMDGRFPLQGRSTHISLRLRSAVPGPLGLSNLIVHYSELEQS